MYTITLSNGTKLENLELNGNNYISRIIIDDSVFEDNLDRIVITNNETGEVEIYTNMILMSNRVDNGHSWFVINEKSEQQKKEEIMAREIAELHRAMTALLIGEV